MSFMCIQQMLDYGMNEHSATEMKARVLKHITEMVLPILNEPTDPSDNKSQEVSNVFNCFAAAFCKVVKIGMQMKYGFIHTVYVYAFNPNIYYYCQISLVSTVKHPVLVCMRLL